MKSYEHFLLSVVWVAILGGCSQDTRPGSVNEQAAPEPVATATSEPEDHGQVSPEPVPTVTPEPKDYNAIAFRRARRAATAAMRYNWSTANTMLETIDIDRITDIDTQAYVDYCKRIARVAQDIGVSTKSDPDDLVNTVTNLDLTQLIATVWATIDTRGLSGTAQLVADAKRVRDEIPMWNKLDAKLMARYGTE